MRKITLAVLLLLELILFLGAFYDPIGSIIYPSDPTKVFEAFVKFQFLIIAFLIPTTVYEHWGRTAQKLDNLSSKTDSILSSFAEPLISALREEEFYQDFKQNVAKANSVVDITHLDTLPPGVDAPSGTETEAYYNGFIEMVKRNPHTHFRRVERYSEQKKPWIQKLIDNLGKEKNYSMGCLIIGDDNRKIPHLSVQIIDNKICYLVAVARHTDPHYPRDVKIEGGEISQLWLKYYEEILWGPSELIIENGRFNPAKWDPLK